MIMSENKSKNYIPVALRLLIIAYVLISVLVMLFTHNSIVSAVFNMLFVPAMAGAVICKVFKLGVNVPKSLLTGYIFMWTVLEVVAIPVAWYKKPFDFVVYAVYISAMLLAAAGTVVVLLSADRIKGKLSGYKKAFVEKERKDTIFNVVVFSVMILAVLIFIVHHALYTHCDADDSRFVTNAVDIVRSNAILQTDPTTGGPMIPLYGDFSKDIVSHWMVFFAYLGKVCNVSPVIAAHSYLPVVIYMMVFGTYWMIAGEIYKNKIFERSAMVIIALVVIVFGGYSTHGMEMVTMVRIWQGKAVVASLGIATLIYLFFRIYKEPAKLSLYVLLFMTNISMGLMSGMGIIIAPIMTACYGIVYVFATKKFRVLILMGLTCIPSAVLFYLGRVLTIDKFLG